MTIQEPIAGFFVRDDVSSPDIVQSSPDILREL
jgi:hypothetical protein